MISTIQDLIIVWVDRILNLRILLIALLRFVVHEHLCFFLFWCMSSSNSSVTITNSIIQHIWDDDPWLNYYYQHILTCQKLCRCNRDRSVRHPVGSCSVRIVQLIVHVYCMIALLRTRDCATCIIQSLIINYNFSHSTSLVLEYVRTILLYR